MRAFLDANILFSAAKSDGAVRALLRLLVKRGHEAVADAYVVAEARRNLMSKGPDALHVLDALLARVSVAPAASPTADPSHPNQTVSLAWLPGKDRPVLAAAMRLGCDALITGDRTHFGAGYRRVYGGVAIHSPRSLAELILA